MGLRPRQSGNTTRPVLCPRLLRCTSEAVRSPSPHTLPPASPLPARPRLPAYFRGLHALETPCGMSRPAAQCPQCPLLAGPPLPPGDDANAGRRRQRRRHFASALARHCRPPPLSPDGADAVAGARAPHCCPALSPDDADAFASAVASFRMALIRSSVGARLACAGQAGRRGREGARRGGRERRYSKKGADGGEGDGVWSARPQRTRRWASDAVPALSMMQGLGDIAFNPSGASNGGADHEPPRMHCQCPAGPTWCPA